MSKKGLLEKKEVSSASVSTATAATPLRMSENPFIAPEKRETAKNPFLSSKSQSEETNEEVGSGFASSSSDTEYQSNLPEKTTPSIVNKAKAIEESIATNPAPVSSMVPPSASDKKRNR